MKSKLILLAVALCAAAVSSLSALTLTVAWDPVSGVAGYKVDRAPATLSGSPVWSEVAPSVTGTSYIDANLAPGLYSYRVRAYLGASTSDYSNVATYIPKPNLKPITDSTPVAVLTLEPNQRLTVANTQGAVKPNPNDPVRKMKPNETLAVYAAPTATVN